MKDELIRPDKGQAAIAIHLVNKDGFGDFAKGLSGPQRAALAGQKFTGGGYQVGIVPDGEGWFAVGGVKNPASLSSWCMAKLAAELPAGTYRLAEGEPGPALHGWQTAQYRFARYKEDKEPEGPRVLLIEPAIAEAGAVALVRDLVNTPAEDMGPAALEAEAEKLAKAHGAKLAVTRGEALEREYPMIHAVGRAAARSHAPRLLHLTWNASGADEKAPVVAIVGKGVCFDSGGLDIKPASGMLLMKKDMGGAAHALALAGLVMGAGLKVRLHCLVPAVENAIAGNAFRPGDVLRSRKGLTVEIGNTDAEDQPALFARRDETAEALLAAGKAHDDACWRLPLHEAYGEWLKSDVADTNNAHANAFAGASVAALFLDKFVGEGIDWAHFDTFAWRPTAKPGRPKGGDALGLRAAWHMLRERFG